MGYKNRTLLGRRWTLSCGAAALPKKVRKSFYARDWLLVDTVNCDVRIMWGVTKLLLPDASLTKLDKLAGQETRAQMLTALDKSKQEIAASCRGQAISEEDRRNKVLMELREELRVACKVLEAYRPDVVENAKQQGKPPTSAHTRICQIIEDQQIQCLEEAMIGAGLDVGDVIFDALMVERCDLDLLQAAISTGQDLVKERLGLDVLFKVEPWPADDEECDESEVHEENEDDSIIDLDNVDA